MVTLHQPRDPLCRGLAGCLRLRWGRRALPGVGEERRGRRGWFQFLCPCGQSGPLERGVKVVRGRVWCRAALPQAFLAACLALAGLGVCCQGRRAGKGKQILALGTKGDASHAKRRWVQGDEVSPSLAGEPAWLRDPSRHKPCPPLLPTGCVGKGPGVPSTWDGELGAALAERALCALVFVAHVFCAFRRMANEISSAGKLFQPEPLLRIL